MIHPYSCNIVSIRDKFTRFTADNGRIGSVDPHAAIIGHKHFPYTIWIHDQKCQTILPQISPASATLSVIVVWQEGTSVNSS